VSDDQRQVKLDDQDVGYVDADRRKIVYPFAAKEFPLKPEEENRLIMLRKLVLEYGYQPSQLGIEVSVRSGQTTLPKKADIVVFGEGLTHDPASTAYIIVEVKKKDRKDGLDQLQTYCNNTTAEFGVWFNGGEIVYQHRQRRPHEFLDIPDIPRAGETLDDVGRWTKKDLIAASELKSVFEVIHNHIYANEGFLKEKVFNEMLKVIFIKMIDEKALSDKCEFRITDSELRDIEHGESRAFLVRMNALFARVTREYKDVFKKNDSLDLKPLTLAFVVSRLQRLSLRKTPADVKGTAFQTFVSAHQRGDRGEFFTPHPILQLVIEMLDPSDDERIIDPACGSGGFLVYAMNHVWTKFRKRGASVTDLISYAQSNIRGVDFNPDLAKVAKMYMVLYDDGHTGIFSVDALEEWNNIRSAGLEAGVSDVGPEAFDIILTNPPFGSKGKVSNKRILGQFELGHSWKKVKNSSSFKRTNSVLAGGQVPDVLFIERCLQLLKVGGRMGIVLPNSDLNNLSLQHVREYIKDHARILAVVSLPVGTFISAGANPQPSVLFLQKKSEQEAAALNSKGYPIFMARIEKVGYDLTTKTAPIIYKKDGQGNLLLDDGNLAVVDSEVPEVVSAFRDYRRKHGIQFRADELI
jgi:type I restriction enzyme M protein